MGWARLALFSYAVAVKEFFLGDFALSMGVGLGEAVRLAEEAVRGGFLRGGDPYRVTAAGLAALLGRLVRYGGRWWLVADSAFAPFSVPVFSLWVAPYTRPLWRSVSGAVEFAAVVRGAVGDAWLRVYASRFPFRELARLEERCRRLVESAHERRYSLEFAAGELSRIARSLRRLAARERLVVTVEVSRPRNWGDVVQVAEELASTVRRAREELARRVS